MHPQNEGGSVVVLTRLTIWCYFVENSKRVVWIFAERKVLHLGFELRCQTIVKNKRMLVNVPICTDAPGARKGQLD